MFNVDELVVIQSALVMAGKSATRLSNRADQPASVAAEYRKAIGGISDLNRKVDGLLSDLRKVKK